MILLSIAFAWAFDMQTNKGIVFVVSWNITTTALYMVHEKLWRLKNDKADK